MTRYERQQVYSKRNALAKAKLDVELAAERAAANVARIAELEAQLAMVQTALRFRDVSIAKLENALHHIARTDDADCKLTVADFTRIARAALGAK